MLLTINVLLLLSNVVSSLIVGEEFVSRGEELDPNEDLQIDNGATLSLVDPKNDFTNNIIVDPKCDFFFTTTFGNVTRGFETIINHGTTNFQIYGDSSDSVYSSIYVASIHNLNQFDSKGTLYDMRIGTLVNSGSMQFSGVSSYVKIGDRVQNSGVICLVDIFSEFTDIYGDGCVVVDDSEFVFEGTEIESTIVLKQAGEFTAAGIREDASFKIANFGNDGSIEVGSADDYKSSGYDPEKGILTIHFSSYNVKLDIGLGYVAAKFDLSDEAGVIVKYNGAPPKDSNPIPKGCSCSLNTAVALGAEPTLVVSTYTTEDETDIDTILITKHDNEWTTMTLGGYENTTQTVLTTETVSDATTVTVTYDYTISSTIISTITDCTRELWPTTNCSTSLTTTYRASPSTFAVPEIYEGLSYKLRLPDFVIFTALLIFSVVLL
ncbi:uncharacterized protein SPAPADRAFT_52697 [Spathaspora passalidarum NRRL Y-27907]|uniref:Hyphally-regulated cell wall protein N-terminal domain-containing protein n=1 Tax=Spathaspora passalidarum (strain NRRL Y-27907 / 11-Y1) TaxID=619300 RepID=G3AUS3_SPAPN|nr:uncharacterized protein SPAPADRAFT_52697 [Spathaspora passalidarum NRRL Y-27907]EGW30629.1 hypothetical protein SPAPADRAFT_52697 [Spathaspora passalidarum NRRL Y-27907]